MATTIRMLMVSKYLEKRSKTFKMLVRKIKCVLYLFYLFYLCCINKGKEILFGFLIRVALGAK